MIRYLLAVGQVYTGFLTDKFSKKKMVMVGSFGRAVGYIIFYSAILGNSLIMLGIGTFTIGLGAGVFWIPMNSLIAEKSHKEHRSRAYGLRSSKMGIGNVIGAVIGFTYYLKFVNSGVSLAVIYLPILFYAFGNIYAGIRFNMTVNESIQITYSNINYQAEQQHLDYKIPMTMNKSLLKGTILIMIVLFLSNMNGSISRPFFQTYLLQKINSNPEFVTLVYLPGAIISMLIAPYLGKMVDRIYPAISITISSIIGALLTYLIIQSNSLIMISILWIFDNAVVYMAALSIQNIISRASSKNRGKIFASLSLFENFGGLLGPIIGGISIDLYDYPAPFIISIIIEISLIPVFWIAIKSILPHLEEKKESEL